MIGDNIVEINISRGIKIPPYFTGRINFEKINSFGDKVGDGYIYYKEGKNHREDGPAVDYGNGNVRFYLEGMCFYYKEEWFSTLSEEQKIKALFNIDEWKNVGR